MSELFRTFQEHRQFFLERVVAVCQEREEYRELDAKRLGEVLLLADRVVAACNQQQDNARVADLAKQMPVAVRESQAEALLVRLELWLKGLWWLVDSEGWRQARDEGELAAASRKPNRFNLFETIIRLALLTVEEANRPPEEYGELADPVRGLYLLAKEERNASVHDTRLPRRDMQERRLQAAAVAFVAPVHKHFDSLRTALNRLLTAPMIEDPEADVNNEFQRLIQSVASERRRHLEHFAGRERWLQTIRSHLEHSLRPAGGYLLLIAPEGTGKSALAAKVTDLMSVSGVPLGSNADSVRQLAPWLPGVLLHMGKQSSRPDEITRLLLAQANAMLLHRVDSPPAADPAADLDRAAFALPASSPRREIRENPSRLTEMEYSLSRAQLAVGTGLSQVRYHRPIYEALERLRDERGGAVIVIDALEEIGRHEDRLVFLPPTLPPGVTGLLTVRPNTVAEKWAKRNLHNLTALKLDRLDREDIPPITRVPDDDASGREFNDMVREWTSGVALVVRHISEEVRSHDGDFRQVSIDGSTDLLFRRQANFWRNTQTAEFRKGLGEVLLLLAVFEPVGPLSRGMIQGYLETRKLVVTSPALDDALQPVAVQLEGLREDRLQLAIRAFAKYVREKFYSDKDIVRMLERVGQWLASDAEISVGAAGAFLRYWGAPKRDEKFRVVAEKMIALLRRAQRHHELLIASQLYWRPGEQLVPIAEQALREAAGAGYPSAMHSLGSRLMDGRGLAVDTAEGERWLRKAAETTLPRAMAALGERILDGAIPAVDNDEGERLLRLALDKGSTQAGHSLGFRMYSSGRTGEAASVFLTAFQAGCSRAGNNLAFMLRRGEVPMAELIPQINDLLAPALQEKLIWARVNKALALASGFQCVADWRAADALFAEIRHDPPDDDIADVVGWWRSLADQGDPEGHLVLSWLARHGLAADPEGLSLSGRMASARVRPWADAPDWLECNAS